MTIPVYNTGTVSVTAGGNSVFNAGTAIWSSGNAKEGDFIVIAGLMTMVLAVVDTEHLTIPPWQGANQSSVPYTIYQNYSARDDSTAIAKDVGTLVAALNKEGFIWFVGPTETAPDPSRGDDGQYGYQPTSGKQWHKEGGAWVYDGIFKGLGTPAPYDNGKTYLLNEVASLGGTSYVWSNSTPGAGHSPPNATYWTILAAKGETGLTGATGASYAATSATSLAIGTGSKAFTTQAGLAYTSGARVRASSSANAANWVEGVATYSGTTLTIDVDKTSGSGTIANWNLNIAGQPGAGDLSSANNLSDLTDKDAALVSLRLAGDFVSVVHGSSRKNYSTFAAAVVAANALAAAITVTNLLIEVPAGDFTSPNVVLNAHVTLRGKGDTVSRILLSGTTGIGIDANWSGATGSQWLEIRDIAIIANGSVARDFIALKARNSQSITIDGVRVDGGPGQASEIENCNFVQGERNFFFSEGSTALRIKGGSNIIGGSIHGIFRTAVASGAVNYYGPPVLITGLCSGLQVKGKIGGAGPRYRHAVNSIASDGSGFTVGFSAAHNYRVGDDVIVLGTNVSGYNARWVVGAVPSSTEIKILGGPNLGAASSGCVSSDFAGLIITNEDGSVNECDFSNVLYEAINPTVDKNVLGSWAVILDATRTNTGSLYAHRFNNCQFDTGYCNVKILGNMDSGGNPLIYSGQMNGCIFSNALWAVQARGSVDNFIIGDANVFGQPDVNAGFASNATAIVLTADATYGNPKLKISGGYVGKGPVTSRNYPFWVYFVGSGGELSIDNSEVRGAIGYAGTATLANTGLSARGLKSVNGVTTPTVASASTITLPPDDVLVISGANTISTMLGGWRGRSVDLIMTAGGPAPFATGGTSPNGFANSFTPTPDRVMRMTHNGSFWFVNNG